MSDPLANLTPGSYSPFVTSAATINAAMETIRRVRRTERGTNGGSPELDPALASLTAFVRNDTGGALPEFSVLRLADAVTSPSAAPLSFQEQPLFSGLAPAGPADAFGVLTTPLTGSGSGATGRAIVQGLAVCDLVVNDAAHGYASPAAGVTAALASAASGPAKIVWKSGTSGTVRAVVLLGADGSAGVTGTGTDNHIVRWDGTGVAAIQDSDPTIDDSGVLTAHTFAVAGSGSYFYAAAVNQVGLYGPGYGGGAPNGTLYLGNLSTTGFAIIGTTLTVFGSSSFGAASFGGNVTFGGTVSGGGLVSASANNTFSGNNSFTGANTYTASGAGATPLTVTGAVGQTADLFRVNDSGGAKVLGIGIGSAAFSSDSNLFKFIGTINATVGYQLNGVALAAADVGAVPSSYLDTDGALAANSDAKVATQKAVKTYVDTLSAGLRWKAPVRAATTANGTLATAYQNGSAVDGVTLATGDRVLIKNQTTGAENGIYVVAASGAPARATDADSAAELDGAAVFVTQGSTNADRAFVQTADSVTVGTTALVWTQFSGNVGALLAANNLSDLGSAATARTNLGATTVGGNLFTLTNPGAITFLRINADNTVSALDAASFRTAIGAASGTVTTVSVVTANGVSGSVATATTTPAITLTLGAITPSSVAATGAGSFTLTDAGTTTAPTVQTLTHRSSGTPGIGFGLTETVSLDSSTNTLRTAGERVTTWVVATDASRRARVRHTAYDTAEREYIRGEASGTVPMIGFLGTAASAALASPDLGTLATTFGLASGSPTLAASKLTGAVVTGVIHIQDQKASATDGGTSTSGSWQTRTLNTKVVDTVSIGGIVSSQFLLPAGTYRVHARAPFLKSAGHQIRLQNITDGTTAALGENGYSGSADATVTVGELRGRFTLAGSKTCELQYRVAAGVATQGLGVANGWGTEVYADLWLEKEAT